MHVIIITFLSIYVLAVFDQNQIKSDLYSPDFSIETLTLVVHSSPIIQKTKHIVPVVAKRCLLRIGNSSIKPVVALSMITNCKQTRYSFLTARPLKNKLGTGARWRGYNKRV